MPFEASGTTGVIFAGYHRACEFSSWEFHTRDDYCGDHVTVLTAEPTKVDKFWLNRSSRVTVKLRMSRCWWIWDEAQVMSPLPLLIHLFGDPRSLPLEI